MGLRHREIKRSGGVILGIISEVQQLPDSALPQPLPPIPDRRQSPELIRSLKATVRQKAAALTIPPQLLVDNRTLEALVRRAGASTDQKLPVELRGWRQSVIAEELLAVWQNRAEI